MANIEFGVPILDAVFTYAFRDTGDAWPDLVAMDGGVVYPQRTFSFPACDEIKINASLTSSQLVKLVYFSGLSLDGLNFQVFADSPLSEQLNVAQSVETIVRSKKRQVLEWSAISTNEVEIIITGVDQRVLDIEQVVFVADTWEPIKNFNGDQPNRIGAIFSQLVSQSIARQKINTKLRRFQIPFQKLSENEVDQIDHIINERTSGGFVLVRLDPSNTTGKYNFLASIAFAGGESAQFEGSNEQTILNALEAYER